jgi:hypothetical protein
VAILAAIKTPGIKKLMPIAAPPTGPETPNQTCSVVMPVGPRSWIWFGRWQKNLQGRSSARITCKDMNVHSSRMSSLQMSGDGHCPPTTPPAKGAFVSRTSNMPHSNQKFSVGKGFQQVAILPRIDFDHSAVPLSLCSEIDSMNFASSLHNGPKPSVPLIEAW